MVDCLRRESARTMQVRQAKLGVSKMMQPWSCEEDGLASEFQKIKKKEKKENSAARRLWGWKKNTDTTRKKSNS